MAGFFPLSPVFIPFIAPTLVFVGETKDTGNATAYTFTGAAISNAAPNRHIIVVVLAGDNSSGGYFDPSITIDGNTMTTVIASNSNSTIVAKIAALYWPTGTTAEFIATFAGAMDNCALEVYAAYGLESITPIDTENNTTAGDPITFTGLTVPANGFQIGVGCRQNTTGAFSVTGTNVTEDASTLLEGGTDDRFGLGSLRNATAVDVLSDMTFDTNEATSFCIGASWR